MQKVANLLVQVSRSFVTLSGVVFAAFAFETFFPSAADKLEGRLSAAWLALATWIKSM